MSVFPCSACGKRKPGKLASVYWAWFNADQQRSAWRQRLCADCYVKAIRQVIIDSIANPDSCPICHAEQTREADPLYATVYLPKREPEEYAFMTCDVDAAFLRAAAQAGAQKLADREVGVRGPSPSSSTSAWDAIGLAPAE